MKTKHSLTLSLTGGKVDENNYHKPSKANVLLTPYAVFSPAYISKACRPDKPSLSNSL